ncbi:Preprotein translocase subunit SECY, chloroplastic [Senna tora]|uniref:Preprotein translocase subunit SECY, chloroplastic n=1 Tax=Senna tora TaxID=362788 RepID=A0A834TT66_9FABA|nr:Preprotein translocase subunit SECY, chloroplastic [Senna tora]
MKTAKIIVADQAEAEDANLSKVSTGNSADSFFGSVSAKNCHVFLAATFGAPKSSPSSLSQPSSIGSSQKPDVATIGRRICVASTTFIATDGSPKLPAVDHNSLSGASSSPLDKPCRVVLVAFVRVGSTTPHATTVGFKPSNDITGACAGRVSSSMSFSLLNHHPLATRKFAISIFILIWTFNQLEKASLPNPSQSQPPVLSYHCGSNLSSEIKLDSSITVTSDGFVHVSLKYGFQKADRKIPRNNASRYTSRTRGLDKSAYLPFKLRLRQHNFIPCMKRRRNIVFKYDALIYSYHDDKKGSGVTYLAVDILPTGFAKEVVVSTTIINQHLHHKFLVLARDPQCIRVELPFKGTETDLRAVVTQALSPSFTQFSSSKPFICWNIGSLGRSRGLGQQFARQSIISRSLMVARFSIRVTLQGMNSMDELSISNPRVMGSILASSPIRARRMLQAKAYKINRITIIEKHSKQ